MNRIEKLEDAATTAGAKAMVKATNCVGKLMTKRAGKILVTLPLALSLMAVTVFADGGTNGGAEGTINTIIGLLKTWIPRLGALLVVVGGIQLGIGFKDDDQTGKTRGMQCMIGGAIVAAIGASVSF
jgi:hypothetical protein